MSTTTHCFRIRWRLEHTRELSGLDKPLVVNLLPEKGECELKLVGGETRLGGQDLALRSPPFSSADAAKTAGETALAGLLLASLRMGFGLSIQERQPTGVVTNAGLKLFAGNQYDTVYRDSYGLTMFEEIGRTGFIKVGEVGVLVTTPVQSFLETWSAAANAAVGLDERTFTSYELYASSRFENSSRARFLLLVMAVEALAKEFMRPESEIILVDRMLDIVREARLAPDQKDALLSGVGRLKFVSKAHACRTHISRSIAAGIVTDSSAADQFTACNEIRGRIVHGGTSPSASELTRDSNRMEKTVRELIMASIEGRAV